jgi:hypothetical protein
MIIIGNNNAPACGGRKRRAQHHREHSVRERAFQIHNVRGELACQITTESSQQ